MSKSRELFAIARNSTFTYKGRAVDLKQVGRQLGVRYVLEGSVRKSGNRVRVTTQLAEAATSGHIWDERYDRDLADIFAAQDEVAASESVPRASPLPASTLGMLPPRAMARLDGGGRGERTGIALF